MRVLIMTLPPMLRDIFAVLAGGVVNVEIVAELDRRAEPVALQIWAPDCVLIGLQPAETDAVAAALSAALPAAQVVAISHDGRDAFVHEMPGRLVVLRDVAPAALAAAIFERRWV